MVEDIGEELFSNQVLDSGMVVVGGERGVLRIFETTKWQEGKKMVIKKGESLDILGRIPEGPNGIHKENTAVGMGDGIVKIVNMRERKVIGELRHDEAEGVVGLGFEAGGRMISSGGSTLKVWQENNVDDEEDENQPNLRNEIEDSEASEAEQDSDSSEEETERKRRKRRKRGKDKASKSRGNGNGMPVFKGLD